jgi:hypothetical protein
MEAIVALVMVFGVPISAILSNAYIKAKKLDLEKASMNTVDTQKIEAVLSENQQLRARIENLESILSEVDVDTLKLKSGPRE